MTGSADGGGAFSSKGRECERNSNDTSNYSSDESCRSDPVDVRTNPAQRFESSENSSSVGGVSSDTAGSDDSNDDEPEERRHFMRAAAGECMSLREGLAAWARKNSKISHSAINELLLELKSHGVCDLRQLPKDVRTLKHVEEGVETTQCGKGRMHYFGVEHCAKVFCAQYSVTIANGTILKMQVNADGLKVQKSVNKELWPLLCRFWYGTLWSKPYMIALYEGPSTPESVNDYIADFVRESRHLEQNGIVLNGINCAFEIYNFVCDAPARAFMKSIKKFNAYFSCERCEVQGKWAEGRVVFADVTAVKRTDESFRSRRNAQHHAAGAASLLETLEIDMVTSFLLESMHSVFLGVVRLLVNKFYRESVQRESSDKYRIKAGERKILSDRLVSFAATCPSEFSRKPRPLSEKDSLKATELRVLLLYTGLPSMLDIVTSDVFLNFKYLMIAVRILESPSLVVKYLAVADACLKLFVQTFKDIYGPENVVYNVHAVLHLADDAKQFGSLRNTTAFPFENYLGTLNDYIHKPNKVLEQVVKRIRESETVKNCARDRSNDTEFKQQHFNGPVPDYFDNAGVMQYGTVFHKGLRFGRGERNSGIVINDKIGKVLNVLKRGKQCWLVYRRYKVTCDFFNIPIASSELGVYKGLYPNGDIYFCPLEMVRKAWLMEMTSIKATVAVTMHENEVQQI